MNSLGIACLRFFKLINIYVLRTPAGYVLVDSGLPGMAPWILARARALGVNLDQIVGIIVTHCHIDHAGGARALSEAGIPVFAHPSEIPVLAGHAPMHPYGGLCGKLLHFAERALAPQPHLRGVRPLEVGAHVFDSPWQVVSAPGHTPGSIALWNSQDCSLLAGDTLLTTFGKPSGPVPLFCSR